MEDKKQRARYLYLVAGKTQKDIALEVGVTERTIYTWIHQYAWNKLKLASYQAPITIADNLSSELVEMQNAIAAREPGKRYPSPQEADVIRKLILSIQAMKNTTSLSQNMQMMETFRDFVRPLNTQFSKQLAHYSNEYLETRSRKGYAPYQMEYGIDMQTAVAPFYEELDGEDPCDLNNPPPYPIPCTDIDECHNEGHCNYPHCKASAAVRNDPKDMVKKDIPWQPVPAPLPPMTEQPLAASADRKNMPETLDRQDIQPLPVPSPDRKQPEGNQQFGGPIITNSKEGHCELPPHHDQGFTARSSGANSQSTSNAG